MPALPELTEQHVNDWTAPRFVERGRDYFRQGRIRNPRRAGRRLKAECQGSQPQPYRVEAALDEGGVATARCSCPMGEGGACKHVVALLLAWVDDPSAFTKTETLHARLQQFSKDQLVALAGEMIDRHPDLEMLLSLPLLIGGDDSATAPVDPEQIRQQVRRALEPAGGYAYDYQALTHTEGELRRILDLGAAFAERGAAQNAVTVYRAFAETLREQYGDFFDPEGDILWLLSSCANDLAALLDDLDAPAVRRAVLKELFETFAWDAKQGGYGVGDAAYGALLEKGTPEEQRRVAKWVRKAFEQAGHGWTRNTFAELLLDLDEEQPKAEQMSDEEYLDLCRQASLTETLIWKLLQCGRPEEALDAARRAGDYALYRAADLFVEQGHADAVRSLISERLSGNPDAHLVEWLRDYAAAHDDPQAAFDLSEQLFWKHPRLEHYRTMREAARALGTWDEKRAVLFERLREDKRYALLTRIFLDEGDYDQALHHVHQAGTGPTGVPGPGLKLQVAEAAAETHPHRAADLYLERACDLIEQRGRSNYTEAARHLGSIRDIYRRIGAAEHWEDLIAAMRKENASLPAFQDELDKAGL